MNDVDKKVEFPAIQADQMMTVVGFPGDTVHSYIGQASSYVGRALRVLEKAYREGAQEDGFMDTETYKRLTGLSKALSELDDLTKPVITSKL